MNTISYNELLNRLEKYVGLPITEDLKLKISVEIEKFCYEKLYKP